MSWQWWVSMIVALIVGLAWWGGIAYIVVHFIIKYW
jgi:hypothetical protein